MKLIKLHPKYLGYIKDPNNNHKVRQIKKYFLKDISKPRQYNNKTILYAKQDDPEECWIKFMFGSEKYHHTMAIDLNRVARAHWLFSVLDYLENIDPDLYDEKISFYQQSKRRQRIEIKLKGETYLLVLNHIDDNSVMVITAYSKREKKAHFDK